MTSCIEVSSVFYSELTSSSNMDFFKPLIALVAGAMIILFVLTRINSSDRKLKLLFDDTMRNLLISLFMFFATPWLLSLFCFTFNYIIGFSNTDSFSNLISFGDNFIRNLENLIILTIKLYRDKALSDYGPSSIIFRQLTTFGLGTLIVPSNSAPINSLFLSNANTAIGGLNMILVSIAIQRFLINFFVSTNLFYVFLILSLVMRIFPGLREAGDFMYSLSIALFIIYPFLYTLFSYPFYNNPDSFNFCTGLKNKLNQLSPSFSFKFLTPISCTDLSFIETYTIFAIFIPNLIFGLTFSFASNFRKIFDIFQVVG